MFVHYLYTGHDPFLVTLSYFELAEHMQICKNSVSSCPCLTGCDFPLRIYLCKTETNLMFGKLFQIQ